MNKNTGNQKCGIIPHEMDEIDQLNIADLNVADRCLDLLSEFDQEAIRGACFIRGCDRTVIIVKEVATEV